MLYLLDTSVCVSLLRGRSNADQLRDLECAVSVITAAELEVGVFRSARPIEQRRKVDLLLTDITILPLEIGVASFYGVVRADLQRAGTPIGPLDMLIAAHALSQAAKLITANVGEFRRVKGLEVIAWP
jgi:tRNA(fMet)-specific endonuclease VapC